VKGGQRFYQNPSPPLRQGSLSNCHQVFLAAFVQHHNACGQYTVTVALPVVLDVGYVACNDLTDILKQSLGATLTMADIRTIMCAIMGPPFPLIHNDQFAAYRIWLEGQPAQKGAFNYFHPVHTRERLKAEHSRRGNARANGGADMLLASWTAAEGPQTGLIKALIAKIAAMTMIEQDELRADAPLSSIGLDSLVPVELRNWAHREASVK
jgi:hypothetical protein